MHATMLTPRARSLRKPWTECHWPGRPFQAQRGHVEEERHRSPHSVRLEPPRGNDTPSLLPPPPAAVTCRALSRDQLALLFTPADDNAGLSCMGSEPPVLPRDSGNWGDVDFDMLSGAGSVDVSDDELAAAQLLRHVHCSVIGPLTPLPHSPPTRTLREHAAASTLGSRRQHVREAMTAYGPALIAASGDPSASTQVSFRTFAAHQTQPLHCAVRNGVSAALLSEDCASLADCVVRRARCGNAPGGPYPVIPVTDSLTDEPPLFSLQGTAGGRGVCNVYDLALAVKGQTGWRGAELLSFSRLSDAQLDDIFGSQLWSGIGADDGSDVDAVSGYGRGVDMASLGCRSPFVGASSSAQQLTAEHLQLLVRAAQAHTCTTMIRQPGSHDIAALSVVAREGASLSQLEPLVLQRQAGTLLLATVGMGRARPEAGVYPIIPLLGNTSSIGSPFPHESGIAHGAAVALKHPDKAAHRWRDRSVSWVNVNSLSVAQTAALVSAAQRLAVSCAISDSGGVADSSPALRSSSTGVGRAVDAGVQASVTLVARSSASRSTTASPSCPAAPVAMHDVASVDALLDGLLQRARTLHLFPDDELIAARLTGLLREAILAGHHSCTSL